MARAEAALLLTAALVFLPAAAALQFDVEVDPLANATVIEPMWENSSDTVHEFNVTLENPESVGCNYRLRSHYEMENGTEQLAYSRGYPTWPGDSNLMEIKHYPGNYTGEVNATVELFYCGQSQQIAEYDFEFNSTTLSEAEVETDTLEVSHDRARLNVDIVNTTLVPYEAPGFWRLGHAEVGPEGFTTVDYEAPIFDQRKNISYAVIQDGEMIGVAETDLREPEPTFWERLAERTLEAVAALLIISLATNLYQARRRILPDKVFEKLDEFEFEGRDLKKS